MNSKILLFSRLRLLVASLSIAVSLNLDAAEGLSDESLRTGQFRWQTGGPLISPVVRPEDPCISMKDPTVVFHEGRWHVFCTIRSQKRTHQIEYLSFPKWEQAERSERHILKLSDGYFCAPQVFYYSPQRKWYMILQISVKGRAVELQPAFATTGTLDRPMSWSQPVPLYERHPDNVKMWIDFWVIGDGNRMHLFFTSLDGRMWRAETKDFPGGWSDPKVVLQGDIFEASHTYRLKGRDEFLTVVEAQNNGRRYYKAYTASKLDGQWKGLADSRAKPFASPLNVRQSSPPWTDSFSHGELLRVGVDERLEVDPNNFRFLYQGVSDTQREGKKYGDIPWRLGLLTPTEE